ncbi:ATP-binding protein [Streptomyces sp. NPDC048258]|uniref:ATP-binding protein n=1 Tax=Streptomyces sp. NPDC048258 TaxID=3365527 RepID=UPI003722188A
MAAAIHENEHVPAPDDWAGAFGDATVAAAMLDRLLHRAAVVGIDGPSYRLRSHQSHSDNLRRAVTGRAG